MPTHSAAKPNNGIRRSSDFATKLHHGTSDGERKDVEPAHVVGDEDRAAGVVQVLGAVDANANAGGAVDRVRPEANASRVDRRRSLRHAKEARDDDDWPKQGRHDQHRQHQRKVCASARKVIVAARVGNTRAAHANAGAPNIDNATDLGERNAKATLELVDIELRRRRDDELILFPAMQGDLELDSVDDTAHGSRPSRWPRRSRRRGAERRR